LLAENKRSRRLYSLLTVAALVGLSASALATNPVPTISAPLIPASVAAGSAGFTLSVSGVGFSKFARVYWNGTKRTTTYVSSSSLQATINASDVAVPGTAAIYVQNPTPGGGISNVVYLPISFSKTSLSGNYSALTAATGPSSTAAGDLNGDGKLDLAVTNTSANTVSVFLGNGDGTFKAHVDYATGTGPIAVAIGDVNGDFKQDLVVANQTAGTVSVLLGNGDGTFQSALATSVGSSPSTVVLADFNRDGHLDLAVTNPSLNQVTVCLGNGNGTFGTGVVSSAGTYPVGLAVGDMDLDNKLDLVAADRMCSGSTCSTVGTISVMRGNGDGTFKAPLTYSSDYLTSAVAVADFNGDGLLDVAAVNSGLSASGSITIFKNLGSGNFSTPTSYTAGNNPTSVVIGDFNDDGHLDVAALNSGDATVSLGFGNGDGTFGGNGITATGFSFNGTPTGLAVADFNNDGQLDLAAAESAGSTVGIVLQAAAPAGVTLSPGTLNFGVQPVNRVSPSQTVTLTNAGGATLTITSITVSSYFKESNKCSAPLSPGANCTISVAFEPTAFQAYTGTVTVTDNAGNSPQTVSLSGTGTLVLLSTTSLNFGNVTVGGSSTLPITVTNLSTKSINVTSLFITQTGSEYSETNNCTPSIAGKASCTINVTFAPTATGTDSATLYLNTSGGPQSSVSLTGTGQ
jgi:hypothetical protein